MPQDYQHCMILQFYITNKNIIISTKYICYYEPDMNLDIAFCICEIETSET